MKRPKFTSLTKEQLLELPIRREADIGNMAGAGATPFKVKERLDESTGKVYQENQEHNLVREAPTDNSPFGDWHEL